VVSSRTGRSIRVEPRLIDTSSHAAVRLALMSSSRWRRKAVHNVSVRAQRDREEQSVLIGTALGVFALVSTAEALGLWLAHFVFDFDGSNAMVGWVVVIAGTLAIANLVRSEKS
jgi:hypothetical protein